jgi:hypothetical protein
MGNARLPMTTQVRQVAGCLDLLPHWATLGMPALPSRPCPVRLVFPGCLAFWLSHWRLLGLAVDCARQNSRNASAYREASMAQSTTDPGGPRKRAVGPGQRRLGETSGSRPPARCRGSPLGTFARALAQLRGSSPAHCSRQGRACRILGEHADSAQSRRCTPPKSTARANRRVTGVSEINTHPIWGTCLISMFARMRKVSAVGL